MASSQSKNLTIAENVFDVCHALTIATIPVALFFRGPYIVTILTAVVLALIGFVLSGKKIKDIPRMFFFFLAFYMIHVFGLILTDNLRQGFLELETMCALLAFPTVTFLTRPYKPEFFKAAVMVVIITALGACLICHILVLIDIIEKGKGLIALVLDPDYQYNYLSDRIDVHPSYLSVFTIVALFLLSRYYIFRLAGAPRALAMVVAAYFVFFLGLLMSRGPWIATVIAVGLVMVVFNNNKAVRLFLGGFIVFLVLILFLNRPLYMRFVDPVFQMWRVGIENIDSPSVVYHLKSWQCSLESASSAQTFFFGHGVGDEKDVLVSCYSRRDYEIMVMERFNAHNDYLSEFVKNGVLGVAMLIALLTFSIAIAVHHRNLPLFLVTVLLAVASFFESYLNVTNGVFIFSFFISFLAIHNGYEKYFRVDENRI